MVIGSKLAAITQTNGKMVAMESSRALPRDENEPQIIETVPPTKASIRIRRLDKIETTGEKMTGISNS